MQVGEGGGLLYYDSRVEVLAPEWLREEVAEEMRRAAEVYMES
jgi:hypothetical protein